MTSFIARYFPVKVRACLRGGGVAKKVICGWGERTISGNTSVEFWLVAIILSVFSYEHPQDFVKHAGPDVTDGVDALVELDALVGLRVGGHAGRVQVVSDTGGITVYPSTHSIVCLASVALLQTNCRGEEVTPAFLFGVRG
jgi:hypothetical protein